MPNTLTGLIPTIYQALDVVSRELIGMILAVNRNTSAARAAKGDPVRIPVARQYTASDILSAATPPHGGYQDLGYIDMSITKARRYPISWDGEQQLSMTNAGIYDNVLGDQFEQGFRTLANEIETDLWLAGYQGASRAYGTPGTTPFATGTDLSDASQVRRILDDNGAPQTDLHMVLGSAAVANLRGKQTILLKANENSSPEFRRTGRISEEQLNGFWLHNSNSIRAVDKGTGAGYVTSGSTAKDVNEIALVTGTGTVLAGDVVTFAADGNNKYVVNNGVAAPGTITIGSPGARATIPTANALTVGGSYTPNLAFHRSAIQLVTRAPAAPKLQDGKRADLAIDAVLVTDPVSGITFEVASYPGYRMMTYEIGVVWGTKAIKSAHIANLIG